MLLVGMLPFGENGYRMDAGPLLRRTDRESGVSRTLATVDCRQKALA